MTQRDRIALTVILLAVAVAAFWMGVLGPKRSEAAKLGQQVSKETARLEQAKADLTTFKAARADYRTNYATVARLGKAVPADDDVASLVYQLDSTADRNDVDFHAIQVKGGAAPSSAPTAPATQSAAATLPPGASVGPAGFPTMPFSFTFDGNFRRLHTFFGRLEQFIQSSKQQIAVSGRLLTIDGISMAAAPSGFPRVRASVTATAYLIPREEGLSNGASPAAPAPSGQPASGSGAPATPTTATAAPTR
jgi:hypothetical protein